MSSSSIDEENELQFFRRKIKFLEEENAAMKERMSTLEYYVKNEVSKIDNPQVLANSMRNGDFLLENKWLVRAEFLKAAAENNGPRDLSILYDSVFGKDLLRKYKSTNEFSIDLKAASSKLLGKCHYSLLALY
jgi:hypothetical protein